jgi:hypothetical protein
VADSCEQDNEPSGYIYVGNLLSSSVTNSVSSGHINRSHIVLLWCIQLINIHVKTSRGVVTPSPSVIFRNKLEDRPLSLSTVATHETSESG